MYLSLPFLLLCMLVTSSVSAQFVPVRTNINTPYGTRSITTYQYSPMRLYGGSSNPSLKYNFTVVLLNDSVVKDRGRIDITDSVHSITFKEGKTKVTYTPGQTKELYRITVDGEKMSGIPADTCWLFKTEKGRVNLYSCVAEPGTSLITALQVGQDGPVESLTRERVIAIVKDHPSLLKLAQKDKLVRALRAYNKLE